MATFGRDGEGTTIGTHVKLTGVLLDTNDITVLGKIDGDVHSELTVTVAENAAIRGPVTGRRVIVGGEIRGNIRADERLEILPKGMVSGNIETRDLVIHSGASFNGRSQIIGGDLPKPEPLEEPAAEPSREGLPQVPESRPEPPKEEKPVEQPHPPGRRIFPIRLARFMRREEKREEQPPQLSAPEQPKEEKPPYEVE